MCRIALGVFEKLQSDVVDDLYFEGGRDRRAFRKLLATGGASTALLGRAVDVSASTAHAAAAATDVWRDVIRGAFQDVAGFEFSATDAAAMAGVLSPLAAVTSHPPLLRLLASMLLQEVVDANALPGQQGRGGGSDLRGWATRSLMAPLLGVTTYMDPEQVLRNMGGKLDGGLPAVLAEVPGYPRNRCDLVPVWLRYKACTIPGHCSPPLSATLRTLSVCLLCAMFHVTACMLAGVLLLCQRSTSPR